MKRWIASFLFLGLAVAGLQAAPTIIQSGPGGAGTQFNTGVMLPGGASPSLTANTAPTSGSANIVVSPVAGWSPAVGASQWISFTNDNSPTPVGQNYCSLSHYAICNGDYVTFYQDFTLSGSSSYAGTLDVMADDTASVWINGHQLFAAAGRYSSSGNDYDTCSDVPVGCLNPGTIGIADMSTWLTAGVNRLVFQVYQRNGTGFGLDYYTTIINPEPGFYGVLALGMAGLCLAIRRKRRA